MAKRPKNAIYFGCPRCQARLWARPRHAGRRLRCPACQFVQPVPTAEEAATRAAKSGAAAEYALHEDSDPSTSNPEYTSITCPVCATRMYATLEQVGQTMACPDCDTVVEVRAPVEPSAKTRLLPPADPGDEYPVWGVEQPPPDVKSVHQKYIPVVCSLCQTRMLATEAEVGQRLTCPDCGTESVVLPPKPTATRKSEPAAAAHEDEYAICAEAIQAHPDSAAYKALIPVVCTLCNTRLHASPEQVGSKLICPDCKTSILVRNPTAAPRKIDPMADGGADYAVAAPIGPQACRSVWTSVWDEDGEDDRPGEPDNEQPAERASPRRSVQPSAGMNTGLWRAVLCFPLMHTVWPLWLLFSVGMVAVLCLLGIAIRLLVVPEVVHWVVALGFFIFGGMAAVVWLVAFAANAVIIVVETAAGIDSIDDWPEGAQNWLPDAFYVINALVFGGVPGVVLRWLLVDRELTEESWLLADPNLTREPWLLASLFVMVPIVLLSMLEWPSIIRPLSPPILASLLWNWWAWLQFYLASAVLVASAAVLATLAVWGLGYWGAVPAVPILVGAMLVYFRMLGRLGMACAGPRK